MFEIERTALSRRGERMGLALCLALWSFLLFPLGARASEGEILPADASASSQLYEPGYDYSPASLFDYDWTTCWAEGVSGYGAGEAITLQFPAGATLSGFSILPGYYKSEDLFYMNGAPTRIRVTSGSFSQDFDLSSLAWSFGSVSTRGEYYPFSSPLSTAYPLTLTILECREGSAYEDCTITELHFKGSYGSSGPGPGSGSQAPSDVRKMQPVAARASSVLYEEGYDYDPWRMFDGDWSTGWSEGASGNGQGEYVDVTFAPGTCLRGVTLLPGFWKTEALFFRNGAPTKLAFSCNGEVRVVDVSAYVWDYGSVSSLEGPYFAFDSPLFPSDTLRVTIQGVREGSWYEDCLITEMGFYGYSGAVPGPGSHSPGPFERLTETTLEHLVQLGQKMYEHHLDFGNTLQSIELTAKDFPSADKAFAFYWYLYHRLDPRTWVTGAHGEYLGIYASECKECIREVFATVTEKDWEAFVSGYVLKQSGDVGYINGIGDFGSLLSYLSFEDYEYYMEGERLCIKGSVKRYDVSASNKTKVGSFRLYYEPSDKKAMEGWSFSELVVW